MIGIGAVKYADLSTDRIKDYVFDWDRMLAFDGNTAPYLQYAHARICSIFRRAEVDRASVRGTTLHLDTPRSVRWRCACSPTRRRSTRRSTRSARTSCARTSTSWRPTSPSFYEHCPVLKADEPVRSSRLALADLTARVLEHGLGLLGIDAPDQM